MLLPASDVPSFSSECDGTVSHSHIMASLPSQQLPPLGTVDVGYAGDGMMEVERNHGY